MTKKQIDEFAKSRGYVGCTYIRKWNGYDIYARKFDESGDPYFVGPPLVIMVKGEEIRMSTVEEAFAIIDEEETEDPL